MLGFDFDGVIVSDTYFAPTERNAGVIHPVRDRMRPLFIPSGEYFILTSRFDISREHTCAFINAHMSNNLPSFVCHERNLQERDFEYKIRCLAELVARGTVVDAYVESDSVTVQRLKEAIPSLNVVHFSDFVVEKLKCLQPS